MRKATNSERIEGRLYQHNIIEKTVSNTQSTYYGKTFLSGNLEIAVDEEGLNVIPVHFSFVTPTTASGAENKTYTTLKRIMDEEKTWIKVGKDDALKLRVDTAIALNDFYNQNDELVSTKINEGGFVTIITTLGDEAERNKFTTDMVIMSVSHVDANEEKHIEAHTSVKGYIFNFRNGILPVEFSVKNENGMKYFEDLTITPSEPIYTKVWGKINCETKVTEVKEESAFGEAAVRTYERKTKEWVITGTAKMAYDFGDENILTMAEITKAQQDREIELAEIKKRSDEYRAQRAATTTTSAPASSAATTATSTAGFSF